MKECKDVTHTKKKELEDAYRVKKRTIDLLPDAEINIIKLEVFHFILFGFTIRPAAF